MIKDANKRASMLSFDDFDHIFAQELVKIPEQFKKGVAQFIIEDNLKRHTSGLPGLYILGQYMPRGHIGQPVIMLFFGSFKRAFPHYRVDDLRLEVARTITHELLHHWEISAGIDDLGDEDRNKLAAWKRQTKFSSGNSATGKNLVEATLYLYLTMILVGLVARWAGIRFY